MSAITGYDITIPCSLGITKDEVEKKFRENCKQYVFQKEIGKSGYEHFQCRIRLKKAKRFNTLKKEGFWIKGNWSITSKDIYLAGDNFYVMKEDTRVDGPFCEKDEVKVVTRQLKDFLLKDLRKYQIDIIAKATEYNDRNIYLIYDKIGNLGKSILAEYMEYLGITEEIPPFRLMDDIFQWVLSRGMKTGFKKSYIFDLPRGMKKDRLGDFYSGIEVIKNGVAYDKRYSGTKARFDRPAVFVFTNTLPKFELMSKDRWIIWEILGDYSYKVKTPKDYENLELQMNGIPFF